ncbi:hypothetical protein GTGU_04095 [Trabulsiella guamensis ATCC 49490]|uniref:Uncharacterized protein n=1 Tax=Trabulsiella guamensis ATCC 49490 TaxID=1005994 RepID=A0A084ZQB2_9ENTR|nr:hypothetical protein [Trabulsiella guamensis]KFB99656.1 hypothetical protein GTGU_04095 [Trabulsiella guamensis ATCC 49490]
MTEKKFDIIIPAGLDYRIANNLACLRFDYRLSENIKLPAAGEFFTGLTVEQAEDTIRFLLVYVQKMKLSEGQPQNGSRHH